MQRVSFGYTIVEVLIFLAVSGFLITSSMTFLSGREGSAHFNQNMHSIQSKMQSWLDDVSNGFPSATTTDYNCKPGGSASVQISSPGGSSTGDCIFLGKAVQFQDSPANNVYVYSVFGCRLKDCSNANGLAASISESGSVPAVGGGTGTGNAHLTDIYNLGAGTTVKSITTSSGITVGGEKSHLAGFYLSLNTDQAIGQNGESNLKAFQYKLGSTSGDTQAPVDCIENKSLACSLGAASDPLPLTDWEICFQNDSNADTALLIIKSNGGLGVSTQLKYAAC